MMRVDRESTQPIDETTQNRLLKVVEEKLSRCDVVLVSDYSKGVCGGDLVARVVDLACSAGVPVAADPVRDADYTRYAGCACVTPNRTEAGLALGCTIRTAEEGLQAARDLLDFGIESAIVTLDREGMAWADCHQRSQLFPARPRQVCDVTGAGDMVLSALGYAIASGADWPLAIELANLAGGLEVERLGVEPLTRDELLAELFRSGRSTGTKIFSIEDLTEQLARRREAGQRIVMTNGCYDLLHPGHIASLEQARTCGDCLVVGVNSDRSVRELKGTGRPIIDEAGRTGMLAALSCVDYVVIFDETSVAPLIAQIRPDVLVKSDQYTVEQVVGHEIVRSYGGEIVLAAMSGSYSTSGLIEAIQGKRQPEVRRDAA